MKKRVVLSPHRAGSTTSAGSQTQPAADKKAALKRRIQDILNGRSRFVIRKVPAARTPSAGQGGVSPSPPTTREEEKKDRCFDAAAAFRSRRYADVTNAFVCPAAASTPRLRRTRRRPEVARLERTEGRTRRRKKAPGRRRKGGRGRKERRKGERPVRGTELLSSCFWTGSGGRDA